MKIQQIIKLFLFAFSASLLFSCEPEDDTRRKITYQVDLSDSVSISYYSDYYFSTGNLKEIVYGKDGPNTWTASHISVGKEKYHIKVKYFTPITDSSNFQVIVFSDDNILDSTRVRKQEVVLEGEIK